MNNGGLNRKAGKAWIVYIIILVIVGFFAMQVLTRMPETNARTRTSRVKESQRDLALKFENYHKEHASYPPMVPLASYANSAQKLVRAGGAELMTWNPQAISHSDKDQFSPKHKLPFAYLSDGQKWLLASPGPDEKYEISLAMKTKIPSADEAEFINLSYDPTNGSFSRGDILRTGPAAQ